MTGALEIVRLENDDMEVEVLPAVGARIHRLRVGGHDVLRTPLDVRRHLDDPYFWGSYVMAPWCNRIDAGPTRGVAGRDLDLPPSFRDGTAIHGQVSGIPWRQTGRDTFTVEAGGDGWPWRYEVVQSFEIGSHFLRIALAVVNLDDGPMPAGLGIHPWFRRPVRAQIVGAEAWDANPSPAAQPTAVSGDLDRRGLEELPDGLDATWTDLSVPPVVLDWPESGLRMTMATRPGVPFIVAASPGEIDAVAIEPETHAPAGIRRLLNGEPGALALVEPGDALTLVVELGFVPAET